MKIEENKLRTVVRLDHATVTVLDDELRVHDDDGIMISFTAEVALAVADAAIRRMRKG